MAFGMQEGKPFCFPTTLEMTMRMTMIAAAGVVLLGSGAAYAQADNPGQQDLNVPNPTVMPETTAPAETMTAPTGASSLSAMTAEDLIGRDIVDGDGNSVGEVEDLMIAPDKQVTHVLVDVGGFLGIGAKTVALQADQLLLSEGDGGDLVTAMAKEQIEALPGYERQGNMWRVTE